MELRILQVWTVSAPSGYVILSHPAYLKAHVSCARERKAMSARITGDLHVANEVLSDIAGYAATQCYGVVGMASSSAAEGIAKLLPNSRLRRGVVVNTTENGVQVDLYVVIEYGTNINVVSKNLVEAVTFAIGEYVQVPIDSVNVHVEGVKVRH